MNRFQHREPAASLLIRNPSSRQKAAAVTEPRSGLILSVYSEIKPFLLLLFILPENTVSPVPGQAEEKNAV